MLVTLVLTEMDGVMDVLTEMEGVMDVLPDVDGVGLGEAGGISQTYEPKPVVFQSFSKNDCSPEPQEPQE